MTNEEKYKTPEERYKAFRMFCDKHVCNNECPCHKGDTACHFLWLALEAEEELLSCPFCGGKAVFHEEQGTFEAHGSEYPTVHYEVYCSRCFAQTSSIVGGNKNMVIEQWNRRVK